MTAWNDVTALLQHAPGDYSVCVWNAAGAAVYGYQQHVLRSAASLIKVPLAMAIVDARLDLDALVTLTEADRVAGDGSFDTAPVGTVKSLRALNGHALVESDNTAANLLIARIGFDGVNRLAEKLGLTTRMRRLFMDLDALAAGRDNLTTAADMCALLYHLLEPRYAELLALLEQAVGTGKLEAGLPPQARVAHKVGDLPGVEHDAGIVFAPNGPYIVAALAVALPSAEAGKRTIAAVSRLIWELMTGPGSAHHQAASAESQSV